MIAVRVLFIVILGIVFSDSPEAFGGNFGYGVHSGYGIIRHEERGTSSGADRRAESRQKAFLFGVSGEYTLTGRENFYAGITTDWAFGSGDDETWRGKGTTLQTNDMKTFGQFYDFRFGYKDSLDRFYYRLYVSGGWDGVRFKRSNITVHDSGESGTSDFSLWRAGSGFGIGYKPGTWALDGRFAYSFYPRGSVENSSYPSFTVDARGTCLDTGIGIARELTTHMNFYAGFSYTLMEIDESNGMKSTSSRAVFRKSRTEIIIGVANLTYAF